MLQFRGHRLWFQSLFARGGFGRVALAAEVDNESYDEALDLISGGAIFFSRSADRVANLPFHRLGKTGERTAAEVDDQIEVAGRENIQRLGRLAGNVDILLAHGLAGFGRDRYSGRHSRALGGHHILAVHARESFSHLAAAGVSDADE